MSLLGEGARARRAIVVRGAVQGVGFRPFVYRVASGLGLTGTVRNTTTGVEIEVEGPTRAVAGFIERLASSPPPAARIDQLESMDLPLDAARAPGRGRGRPFAIVASDRTPGEFLPAPDLPTCGACLAELFDPADRRHGYWHIQCVDCGPRFSGLRSAPYDRSNTTLEAYPLCAACSAEYADPGSRRFHAEAISCPACGPHLHALDAAGVRVDEPDPVGWAAAVLAREEICALQGIGGFHLACDASSPGAVATLRRRKHRPTRPFAVMVPDLEAARRLARVSPEEAALLSGPARPIVLLRRAAGAAALAPGIAPGSDRLGLMLAYAPLHHLLFARLGGRPLVMTSGNRAGGPIARDTAEGCVRLAGIAAGFLVHDRPMHFRLDDSVVRAGRGAALVVRRARGLAPTGFDLGAPLSRPTLALGGHLKACMALGRGWRALVGPHLGDLADLEAEAAFADAIARLEALLDFRPSRIVVDLHPETAPARYAAARASSERLEVVAVQHHHAHFAAVLTEARLGRPAIGVLFDGLGLGDDGGLWGGEILAGTARAVRRVGHLLPVPQPGGDQAARAPWRMAVAAAQVAGIPLEHTGLPDRIPGTALAAVARMVARGVNAPLTSSAGRLFDAAAALAGVADENGHEGQAAAALEALAAGLPEGAGYPLPVLEAGGALTADTRPLVRALIADASAGVPTAAIARRFHDGLAAGVAALVARAAEGGRAAGVTDAVLAGGVFVNEVLGDALAGRLEAAGFQVHRPRILPPNDGALSLGQLSVIAARDAAGGA